MKTKLLIILYVFTILCLFLYSYTQVDLSLTLSRISLWQYIEKAFQYVGYFQRPLSTLLFISILLLLLISYLGLLFATSRKMVSRKMLWILVIFTAVLLTFSYNAFSYDLFNYIFDAKIITHYAQNPYMHSALDFPHDPMLSFMHWTQRTYPYGPVWLFITVPISFVGLQVFLPTFYLFKAIAAVSYILTAWCIEKILKKTTSGQELLGLAIFSFSPLVIVEGLVSVHNDMAMIGFISLSLLAFVNKKSFWSFLLLFLSIGVKFATAVLLPLWIIGTFIKKKGNLDDLAVVSSFLLLIPLVIAGFRTNFQPWYVLFLFPFVALFPKRTGLIVSFTIFSFASLLQYIPFLYTGNWNAPIPMILSYMLWGSVAISITSGLVTFAFQNIAKKH